MVISIAEMIGTPEASRVDKVLAKREIAIIMTREPKIPMRFELITVKGERSINRKVSKPDLAPLLLVVSLIIVSFNNSKPSLVDERLETFTTLLLFHDFLLENASRHRFPQGR